MDILAELNPQQLAAVTAGFGPVLVLAGPGSGKTRVLTRRIAYLIQDMSVRPFNILAMTFTNKAAHQMEDRITSLLGAKPDGLWIGTFHSICARILRREVKSLPGFDDNFTIVDDGDQEMIVRDCIRDLKYDDKRFRPAKIHAIISRAKNDMVMPEDMPVDLPGPRQAREDAEVTRRVYEQYQNRLQTCNMMDFDDLLIWPLRLFSENPQVRERYARRFEHVLVDEFQDTNQAQYQLLHYLSSYTQNLYVVGDEDQSIYRWRGADYHNVLRFEEDHPDFLKILLEQNYRSTQAVLDAARAVIDRNTQRTPKALFTERGQGEQIVLHEAVDDTAEAGHVVDTMQQLISLGKARRGDFAVMYRTNAMSRLLEEAFMRAGQPYHLVGAQRFYGRREIKDLIAYLRLVQNPRDEVSLQRVINVPPRKIGEKAVAALLDAAQQNSLSSGEILLDLAAGGTESQFWQLLGARSGAVLANFGLLLQRLLEYRANLPLLELIDRTLEETGYEDYIKAESVEGEDRWENVLELRSLATHFSDQDLGVFMDNVALVSDQDTLTDQADSATLLTLHAAKGLEFKYVFIIGLDEKTLPHNRSLGEPEEMAEERRLFYVGMTRAKDRLYLLRARRRSSFGGYEETQPSRFLHDIPVTLVHQSSPRVYNQGYDTRRDDPSHRSRPASLPQGGYNWSAAAPRPATLAIEPKFKPGLRVRHHTWGDGIVVDDRVQENEEMVDVHFESVGFKRLLASMARLEIIT
jgi:DNA helicase II / ATP-dependent DNA helicase PcrA